METPPRLLTVTVEESKIFSGPKGSYCAYRVITVTPSRARFEVWVRWSALKAALEALEDGKKAPVAVKSAMKQWHSAWAPPWQVQQPEFRAVRRDTMQSLLEPVIAELQLASLVDAPEPLRDLLSLGHVCGADDDITTPVSTPRSLTFSTPDKAAALADATPEEDKGSRALLSSVSLTQLAAVACLLMAGVALSLWFGSSAAATVKASPDALGHSALDASPVLGMALPLRHATAAANRTGVAIGGLFGAGVRLAGKAKVQLGCAPVDATVAAGGSKCATHRVRRAASNAARAVTKPALAFADALRHATRAVECHWCTTVAALKRRIASVPEACSQPCLRCSAKQQ